MKCGIITELEPGPEPWPSEDREAQVYREAAGQAVLAEELGYDTYWVVEHHGLTGYSSSSAPEEFLAWVAGRTSRIRLGHGVVQTAKGINNLVRIAERAAALDIMCDGRLEFGTGRGFTHAELSVFGVDPDETRPMQIHAMRNLPKMWAEGVAELDDEFYQVPRTRIHPRTVQRPHPPMWMAASQPDTWKIAGELGAGILAFGFANPGQLEQVITDYREAITRAHPPYGVVNDQILFAPSMFCHEDERVALETAAPAIRFFIECNLGYVTQWAKSEFTDYKYYKEIGKDLLKLPELSEEETAGLSPDAAMIKAGQQAGLFCVGTPQQCREFVAKYQTAGVDQLAFVCQLGSLSDEQIRGSMTLFAEQVLPHVRKRQAEPTPS